MLDRGRQLREGALRRALPVAAAIAAVLAASASASTDTGAASYVLGRVGGNIAPYTLTIATDGTVAWTGPVRPARTTVGARTLASLARVVADERFFSLPRVIDCPGTLPDFASTFVRVRTASRARTVTVHGSCSTRFNRVRRALAAAVGVA